MNLDKIQIDEIENNDYIEKTQNSKEMLRFIKLVNNFNEFNKITLDIQIEIWNEHEFYEYFEHGYKLVMGKAYVLNPLTYELKCLEGFHRLHMDNDGNKIHQIALIWNENWEKTLLHEFIHCIQSELVGWYHWIEMSRHYKNDRDLDPFELQAYFLAEQIYKKLKKNYEFYNNCNCETIILND